MTTQAAAAATPPDTKPSTQVRVADYVADTLARHGVMQVFMVTGGGAMHLNDALTRHPSLDVLFCHHEQACAMAAEAYFRVSNRLACLNVTTGPGCTNALTGVMGAWQDSLGMIVISGQVKRETCVRSSEAPLRQLGDQEVEVVPMVAGITKYAAMVWEPARIRYELEKALYLATSGRPGPTWLDIPIDVQSARIDPADLQGFDPVAEGLVPTYPAAAPLADEVIARLQAARRPVVMAGTGVRISGAYADFLTLVESWGIPVVTAFNAHDLLPEDHPCYGGRPGTVGDRPGNLAVQNSDALLVLGCRLNIRQVSYAWQHFARHSYRMWVDIDAAELAKPTVRPDLAIHADLADFLPLLAARPFTRTAEQAEWLEWCRERRARYPVVLPEYDAQDSPLNPYSFMRRLFEGLEAGDVVATANATACVVAFQAALIKPGQRLFSNSGTAGMGYDLPAAIGASLAGGRRRVICLAGDGSLMMNLQELQTIASNRLPIKLFILNNNGYHSIRQTQSAFFPDNLAGFEPGNGVDFPDFEPLVRAFGLGYARVSSLAEVPAAVARCLGAPGPAVVEAILDPRQPFAPKLASRKLPDGRMFSPPLEDMFPFLDRDELRSNLFFPPLEE
ncbi:MAG: thiamine pyrophosphate-binding protein [Candidatus Sericytochromatia bacterium]|nr:thiamine pyrophosphate-binding protein [Candidatus Tanganyikabacteria bacterium]